MKKDDLTDYQKKNIERIKVEFEKDWIFKEVTVNEQENTPEQPICTLSFISPDHTIALDVKVKSDGSYSYSHTFLK